MLRPSIPDERPDVTSTWRDVERLVEETAQFAVRAGSTEAFHATLLERAVQAVAGAGGALWRWSGGPATAASWQLVSDHGVLASWLAEPGFRERHASQLAAHLPPASGEPISLRIEGARLRGTADGSCVTVVAAIGDESERWGVLEIVVADDANPVAARSRANVVAAFAEVATDYHRRRRVAELRQELQHWETWSDGLLRLHGSLDRRATSFVLAEELRRAAKCDRVTVLSWRGRRLRVLAVSGLASVDARSTVVREAERLAGIWAVGTGAVGTGAVGTGAADEPAWWYVEGEPMDECLAQVWQPYLDVSHARVACAMPLRERSAAQGASRSGCAGVVICERWEHQPFTLGERRAIERVCGHAAAALARAAEMEQLPLLGLSRALRWLGVGSSRSSQLRGWTVTVLAVAAVAVAGMWPVEFSIRADGVLQPVGRREVFAPDDGVVRRVLVRQGEQVAEGMPLVELHNDDLELEIARVFGELQTARRQYQSVQNARRDAARPGAPGALSPSQLAAEEERLKAVIDGLDVQHARRLQQRDALVVRSPVAGELLTWDVERLLRERPVRRGQRLMTIAQVEGRWGLELRVADADVGHVLLARPDPRGLPVTYRLASQPGLDHRGVLSEIADWTDPHDRQGPSVRMTAALDDARHPAVRPGAAVAARIHLGPRPRAYVWFRDLIEFVRQRWWW